jgi:hypothetical protein
VTPGPATTRAEPGEDKGMDLSNATWRKSSYSGGNCIEIASLPNGDRAVRDSKDPSGPVLMFSPAEWQAFTAAVSDRAIDLSQVCPLPARGAVMERAQLGRAVAAGAGEQSPGCAVPGLGGLAIREVSGVAEHRPGRRRRRSSAWRDLDGPAQLRESRGT